MAVVVDIAVDRRAVVVDIVTAGHTVVGRTVAAAVYKVLAAGMLYKEPVRSEPERQLVKSHIRRRNSFQAHSGARNSCKNQAPAVLSLLACSVRNSYRMRCPWKPLYGKPGKDELMAVKELQ